MHGSTSIWRAVGSRSCGISRSCATTASSSRNRRPRRAGDPSRSIAQRVAALKAHRKRQQRGAARGGIVVAERRARVLPRGRKRDPPAAIHERVRRLGRDAGLPSIRLHDLRHSYATAALTAGIPAKVVSERLGTREHRDHARHLFTREPRDAGGSCRHGGTTDLGRSSGEGGLMRCERCDNGERRSVRRARMAERDDRARRRPRRPGRGVLRVRRDLAVDRRRQTSRRSVQPLVGERCGVIADPLGPSASRLTSQQARPRGQFGRYA